MLRHTIDPSTLHNYSSALNSYLAFVWAHNFSVEPTKDMLSFFVVYMSQQINSRSVSTYLSGICQQLEPFFYTVRMMCKSKLVQKMMQGCLKMHATPTKRKLPLAIHHLQTIIDHYHAHTPSHDYLLFVTMLVTGFFALLHLGELTFSDNTSICDWWKII